jgi:hypothetical protein
LVIAASLAVSTEVVLQRVDVHGMQATMALERDNAWRLAAQNSAGSTPQESSQLPPTPPRTPETPYPVCTHAVSLSADAAVQTLHPFTAMFLATHNRLDVSKAQREIGWHHAGFDCLLWVVAPGAHAASTGVR